MGKANRHILDTLLTFLYPWDVLLEVWIQKQMLEKVAQMRKALWVGASREKLYVMAPESQESQEECRTGKMV